MSGRYLMNIFSGLEQIVKTNYILSEHTWYGLGGPAEYFIVPQSVQELSQVVKRCTENAIEIRMLGFGSNLLVCDEGVKGAVIKLDGEEFRKTSFNGEQVRAGAGAELSKLVLTCVEKGLAGIEGLTGIPGSVGGSIRMNAGGRFGDIGSAVESVLVMDIHGNTYEKTKPELQFDYRSTNIAAPVIIEARFKLEHADPDQILRTVKEIWVYKKNNQPLSTKNSGCIFKNPRGVSAGALIDRAGLKGMRAGGAVVSDKHANFFIAEKDCKAEDVLKLIDLVKEQVAEKFDLDLELEIEVWK